MGAILDLNTHHASLACYVIQAQNTDHIGSSINLQAWILSYTLNTSKIVPAKVSTLGNILPPSNLLTFGMSLKAWLYAQVWGPEYVKVDFYWLI